MIKARNTDGSIIFGLSDKNIKLLKQGKPIKLNLSEMGLPAQEIYIIHGKTEQDIAYYLGIDLDVKTRGNA